MRLNDSEKADLKKILVTIYGIEARSWRMTPAVLEKLAEFLRRNERCAMPLDLTPRPGLVTPNYVRRQLRGIVRRLVDGEQRYFICELFLKWQWRSVFRDAGSRP